MQEVFQNEQINHMGGDRHNRVNPEFCVNSLRNLQDDI